MVTKSQIKYIQSLHRKKYRDRYELYIVEGEKMIKEYFDHVALIHSIYATSPWIGKNHSFINANDIEYHLITEEDLCKISTLHTSNQVLALIKIPLQPPFNLQSPITGLFVALDHIQDPGNLGTIIRSADWFGLSTIFCSTECAEVYNPKVVQATMGSLARMQIHYTDLSELLRKISLPIYAATLEGKNVFDEHLPNDAVLLIGNESKGISSPLLKLATQKISIPKYGKAESLNAAIATGIILARFKRG